MVKITSENNDVHMWINATKLQTCSECGRVFHLARIDPDKTKAWRWKLRECPACGAKMEE